MTNKTSTNSRKNWIYKFIIICGLLMMLFAFSLLSFVFYNVWNSGLKGGGNGPADAYRHSLASALVAHTLSPKCVTLVTRVMEGNGNSPSRVMDRHNNRLGSKVGNSIPLSWHSINEVNREIRQKVDEGEINTTDPNQIRLMPKNTWVERRFH